jgi:Spy/CpxP family protein refolding chaperone
MTSIRHLLSATALAAAAFAGAGLVQASGPHPDERSHSHAHGTKDSERGAKGFERRMTELKSQLQLTPAQEGAWTKFADAMRPATPAQRPDHNAMMKLPTPERIDQMRALHQQHTAQMDQRGEAAKAFYATLTPEQKKRFDEQSARRMTRDGGMGHHDHHGHRGHHS